MPIRGTRNAMPSKGGKPTGMFSSRGKQKVDSTEGYQKDLNRYALQDVAVSKPTGDGSPGLRHQKPRGR